VSQSRAGIVAKAFKFHDVNNRAQILLRNLFQAYNASAHPRVVAGVKTEQEVRTSFEQTLSRYTPGPYVNAEQFLAYYADIGATIPPEKDDFLFTVIMNTWGL